MHVKSSQKKSNRQVIKFYSIKLVVSFCVRFNCKTYPFERDYNHQNDGIVEELLIFLQMS